MNISNCRRCGKMYSYSGKPICPDCVKKEDEDFEVARAYIKENPGCNIKSVSEETGISVKLLTKFLREKRIEFSDGSNVFISCESCGGPISSGRYCNNCLSKLGKEMLSNTASSKPAPPPRTPKSDGGMHLSKIK